MILMSNEQISISTSYTILIREAEKTGTLTGCKYLLGVWNWTFES